MLRRAADFGWLWLLRSLRPRRWQLVAVIGLTACVYVASLALPVGTQMAIDSITRGRADLSLAVLFLALAASVVIETLASKRRQRLIIQLGGFLDRRISRAAFVQLMRMRIDTTERRAGDLITRFREAGKIRDFIFQTAPRFVFDVGFAFVSLLVMLYYDLVVGTLVGVVTCFCAVLLRSRLESFQTLARENYKADTAKQNMISETAGSLVTVKLLALEGNLTGRWMKAVDHALSALGKLIQQASNVSVEFLTAMRVISLSVAVIGCFRVVQGHLTLGELFALQMLADRVTGPVLSAGSFLRPYQEVNVAIKELGTFLRGDVEQTPSPVAYRHVRGSQVRTDGVTLTYQGRDVPALDNVSLSLPERGVVAIVGRNGSGKTSLLNVLLGLQRSYRGEIEIGHRDLRQYHPRSLRRGIGTVDQETVLFAGSIRDNVSGFRSYSDGKIADALRFSGALAFVEALPDGVDTVVTDNGRNLSGGQRQRLAIARAYIRNPPVVFLDEPTAFLDAEAAVALEERLTEWGRDRLLILISHHLAATRRADLLLVMDEGRLAGRGSHDELLANTPCYAALWQNYMRSHDGAV